MLNEDLTIQEAREWLLQNKEEQHNYYIIAQKDGRFKGIISNSNLFSLHHTPSAHLKSLIKRKPVAVTDKYSLKAVVEIMATENLDVVPVVASAENTITGIVSYKDILAAYRQHLNGHEPKIAIPLKHKTERIVTYGKKMIGLKLKSK